MPRESRRQVYGPASFQESSIQGSYWYVIFCAYECDSTYFLLLPTGQHVVAFEDTGTLEFPTIRHSACELLLPHASSRNRCLTCTKYQKTLRCLCSRHTSKEEDRVGSSRMSSAVSHVNYRYLLTPEKDERLRELHSQHWNAMKSAWRGYSKS